MKTDIEIAPLKFDQEQLKKLIAEAFRNEARDSGCLLLITSIFRSLVPFEGDRKKLEKDNNWDDAIKRVFEMRLFWAQSLYTHLREIPYSVVNSREYKTQLSNSRGPKYVRFYESLCQLILESFDEEYLEELLKDISVPLRVGTGSYAENANYLLNNEVLTEFFTVPATSQEKFLLAHQLGSELFKRWRIEI